MPTRTKHQQRNHQQRRKLRSKFWTDVKHFRSHPVTRHLSKSAMWAAIGGMYRTVMRRMQAR